MFRHQKSRKDTEVGRRNQEGERGREKGKRQSREQLDASHKHVTRMPHWDAGQQGCLYSKLTGQGQRQLILILGHMCVWEERGREGR